MGAPRSLPDLDACLAEVDRICTGARSPGGVEPDSVALLRCAAEVATRLQALGDDLVEEYLARCRLGGRTSEEIGEALKAGGRARPAPFRVPQTRYAAEEVSRELQAAMHDMKAVAVTHQNNYLGTEHVLWGLLWRETSARLLVRSLGVDAEALLGALEVRFGTGAVESARRIAWTPYARAALAHGKELAVGAGASEISCADVLVGLAWIGRGAAAEVLEGKGLDARSLELARTRRVEPT